MAKNKTTVQQIAELAGVSPATVSRVMNHRELVKEETVKAVESAMKELGYMSSPAAKQNSSKGLILLCKPRTDIFYDEVIRGARVAAESSGYYFVEVEKKVNYTNIDDFCSFLLRVGVTGLVLMSQFEEPLMQKMAAIAPIVQCCELNYASEYPSVSVDDYTSAITATEHLIASGRRKIALLNAPLEYKWAYERRQGFFTALSRANITIPAYLEIQIPDNTYPLAYASVSQILRFGDQAPNAIFATSDIMAAAALNAATNHSLKVPEDIMIVGFDDVELAQMTTPTLTTIRQPRYLLGYTACNLVIQQITGAFVPAKHMTLPTELIVRGSTAQ